MLRFDMGTALLKLPKTPIGQESYYWQFWTDGELGNENDAGAVVYYNGAPALWYSNASSFAFEHLGYYVV